MPGRGQDGGARQLPQPDSWPVTFNLACASSAFWLVDWIGLGVLVSIWVRVPPSHPATNVFMLLDTASCLAEIVWRWRCRHAPNRGSYGRWRELSTGLALVNEAVLGPRLPMPQHVAWLEHVGPPPPSAAAGGWRSLVRHANMLLVSSSAPSRFLIFARPIRLCWSLPLHVLMTLSHAWQNGDLCSSAALAHPTARQLTGRIFGGVDGLRYSLAWLGVAPALPPKLQCATMLTYLQLTIGLCLPALLQAATESRLFAAYQARRRAAQLPPEGGFQARVYAGLRGLSEALEGTGLAIFAWVMLGLLFDASLVISSRALGTPLTTAAPS